MEPSVLVHLAAITKISYPGRLKQQTFTSHSLEPGKSKSKELAGSVSGETHFLVHSCLLPVSSHGRRDEGSLWGLFYKGTNPIHESS